jgi:hypothetical protein
MKMTVMMMIMTRGEGADEEELPRELRASSGAGAKHTEGKDGNDDDEVGEKGDAGGVLRTSGADAGGLENKDGKDTAMAIVRMAMLVVCYAPPARMLMA